MDHPKALIRSRKRAAPPSTDAPRVKKKRSSATGKTAIAQDPTVNDHITERNSTSSPLLRLPAELRTMIFRYVFASKIYHFEYLHREELECVVAQTNMGLMFVSRQVHFEAAHLPYELGTFMLRVPPRMQEWKAYVRNFMAKRSPRQIEAMRCVWVSRYAYRDERSVSLEGTGSYWSKRLG